MDKALVEKLTSQVKKLVAGIIEQNPNVIAAYSDGSFAREDMVRGSDVDIGLIVDDEPGVYKVHRKVIEGTLFEWAFFKKDVYEDTKTVLEHAGFVHDLALAKIWFDPKGFLGGVQNEVRQEYTKPQLVKARAISQLEIVENSLEQFKRSIEKNQPRNSLSNLVSIIRHTCALPSAVLNKPLSNCRAYLYCKRDCQVLGLADYPGLVVDLLGSRGFTSERVTHLLSLLYELYDNSGFPEHEVLTYKAHLEIVDYMLEIGESEGAVWPLLFWVVVGLGNTERDGLDSVAQNIEASLLPIKRELRLLEPQDLRDRIEPIQKVIDLGQQIIKK